MQATRRSMESVRSGHGSSEFFKQIPFYGGAQVTERLIC